MPPEGSGVLLVYWWCAVGLRAVMLLMLDMAFDNDRAGTHLYRTEPDDAYNCGTQG